jgi:hypothetical protein
MGWLEIIFPNVETRPHSHLVDICGVVEYDFKDVLWTLPLSSAASVSYSSSSLPVESDVERAVRSPPAKELQLRPHPVRRTRVLP